MNAPDPSPVPTVGEGGTTSFFMHFAQPALLCVLGIAIVLVGIELVKWVYRHVLDDSEPKSGRPQVGLHAVTRPRKRRRKQR